MRKRTLLIVAAVVAVVCVAISAYAMLIATVVRSINGRFSTSADEKFGDQYFKTAISLVELHHTRTGRYPARLSELKFLGDWDGLALASVRYYLSPSGNSYCVTVVRGWVAAPQLTYPGEFFNGTGFDASLCP